MRIVATIACALACATLVVAERRRRPALRVAAKLIASAAFVGVGTLAMLAYVQPPAPHVHDESSPELFAPWMLAGLVLGAVGDVALLGASERAFAIGLVAFLLGHLAYIVGIAQHVPPDVWLAQAGTLALIPVGIGALVLARLWLRLGRMRLPVICYVAAIITMMIGALAAARVTTSGAVPEGVIWQPLAPPGRQLLVAGAALFFASDLAVARDRFIAPTFANKALGLPAYYAGQLLIAWSLAFH